MELELSPHKPPTASDPAVVAASMPPETQHPEVSLIILTKDGAAYLDGVLRQIFAQRCIISYEVTAIDSGSTDGTLDILGRYPVMLHRIPPSEFGHGRTRNLGAKLARGKYLVFLTQDAEPANPDWLEAMVKNFRRSPEVAGVFGRQFPRPDCHPTEMRDLLTYLDEVKKTKRLDQMSVNASKTEDHSRAKLIQFSNANSAIRKEVLKQLPFNERIPMCEDQEWCQRALEAGWTIVYEPSATVLHSHNFSLRSLYQRNRDFGRSYRHFLPLDMRWRTLLGRACKQTYLDWLFLTRSPLRTDQRLQWLFLAPLARLATQFGLRAGYCGDIT